MSRGPVSSSALTSSRKRTDVTSACEMGWVTYVVVDYSFVQNVFEACGFTQIRLTKNVI